MSDLEKLQAECKAAEETYLATYVVIEAAEVARRDAMVNLQRARRAWASAKNNENDAHE